jgi:hypothetical protein
VFGNEKLLAFRVPTELESARMPKAAATQTVITRRRWAIVQRVSLSIGLPLRVGKFADCALIAWMQLKVNTECRIAFHAGSLVRFRTWKP